MSLILVVISIVKSIFEYRHQEPDLFTLLDMESNLICDAFSPLIQVVR
jgi:hypothetical protein